MLAPYQAVRCADGFITIGAGTDRLFQRLCDLLGHADWAGDPRFANETLRVRHRVPLIELVESVTAREPRAHWLERLEAGGVPCGPINDYAEAFADPHVRAREMVVELDHPALGRMRTLGSPLKMSETPPAIGRPAPRLGEHTREVLREAGLGDADIDRLI
jgi:crotonobetainyl-CoA:carnitine CoA-transferase CaiB-like acyl-CoA transferase